MTPTQRQLMGIKRKAKNLRKDYGDFAHLRVLEAIARAESDPLSNHGEYWRKVLDALNKLPRKRGTLFNERK